MLFNPNVAQWVSAYWKVVWSWREFNQFWSLCKKNSKFFISYYFFFLLSFKHPPQHLNAIPREDCICKKINKFHNHFYWWFGGRKVHGIWVKISKCKYHTIVNIIESDEGGKISNTLLYTHIYAENQFSVVEKLWF